MRPVASLLCFAAALLAQKENAPPRWTPSVTLQTGFASTFQLNLGGTFGGTAWQNRATVEFSRVFAKTDALLLSGFSTDDVTQNHFGWNMGAAYRFPAWRKGNQGFIFTSGWQRWLFPYVLNGMSDHVLVNHALYRTKVKVPLIVTVENQTLLSSHLNRGNLLIIQGQFVHTLWDGTGGRKLMLRHGPFVTRADNFWGRNHWRVFRYGGSLAFESKQAAIEAGFRQQAHIAPGLPDNQYWSVMLTRRF